MVTVRCSSQSRFRVWRACLGTCRAGRVVTSYVPLQRCGDCCFDGELEMCSSLPVSYSFSYVVPGGPLGSVRPTQELGGT